jgi:DNA mismatch repair ATPase MutS
MLIPVLILIIPFFVLKIKKVPITMQGYLNILTTLVKHHGIGKALLEFSTAGMERKLFIIVSVIFYLVNIYQNFMSCYNFYKNIYKIREYLLSTSNFLTHSINSITNFNKYCGSSYLQFKNKNSMILTNLINFNKEIKAIRLEKFYLRQIAKIGDVLKVFYKLYKNDTYYESVKYALYFDGYIDNLLNIKNHILEKTVNFCKFTKGNTKFRGSYYAALIKDNPIKNSYKMSKNIIITGPNASGKTTLLKASLFNIILSQQFGVGCFKSAQINPYNFIYSYINIPDTSDRDSLFQAEARRCKEILGSVANNTKNSRHFCIFDEIYSGTNPTEAVASAYSFLNYITQYNNFDYLLTTHYVSLCEVLNTNKKLINMKMSIDENNEYTYKLISGISTVKGGITVLNNLEYPEEIIRSSKKLLNEIQI